ncbi:hypothetical protein CerSpe_200740 [Prunus speciosa]
MVVGRERLVQESDLSQLNYVKACAREAFRLHPIAPFNVRQLPITSSPREAMCCLATQDLATTLKSGMNLSSLCPSAISRKMIVCGLAHRDRAALHIIQHRNVRLRSDCTWHFKDSHVIC